MSINSPPWTNLELVCTSTRYSNQLTTSRLHKEMPHIYSEHLQQQHVCQVSWRNCSHNPQTVFPSASHLCYLQSILVAKQQTNQNNYVKNIFVHMTCGKVAELLNSPLVSIKRRKNLLPWQWLLNKLKNSKWLSTRKLQVQVAHK